MAAICSHLEAAATEPPLELPLNQKMWLNPGSNTAAVTLFIQMPRGIVEMMLKAQGTPEVPLVAGEINLPAVIPLSAEQPAPDAAACWEAREKGDFHDVNLPGGIVSQLVMDNNVDVVCQLWLYLTGQFHGPLWRDQHRAHVISVQGLQIAPPISWDSTDPPLLAALSYIMTLVWDDQDKSRLVFSSVTQQSQAELLPSLRNCPAEKLELQKTPFAYGWSGHLWRGRSGGVEVVYKLARVNLLRGRVGDQGPVNVKLTSLRDNYISRSGTKCLAPHLLVTTTPLTSKQQCPMSA
eukprot:jgi/Astpho2/1797/Aster-07557